MASSARIERREQLLAKLQELWKISTQLEVVKSSWEREKLRSQISREISIAAVERGLRYAVRLSARRWGLPKPASSLDTALAVLFRCSNKTNPRRQALVRRLHSHFVALARLPVALKFERYLTVAEFNSILGDQGPPDASDIKSYFAGRSLQDYPQCLDAAVSREPSFCHLFPRYANPSFPWLQTHATMVKSIGNTVATEITRCSSEDESQWKSWLVRLASRTAR